MGQHLIFLTDEEVNALLNASRAGLKMSDDGSEYFQEMEPALKSAFNKLSEKWSEISDADRE